MDALRFALHVIIPALVAIRSLVRATRGRAASSLSYFGLNYFEALMRFLALGFRRPSFMVKQEQRPVRIIDVTVAPVVETSVMDEDAAIAAVLRELGEDPFDVWARLCAPVSASDRELAVRRPSKRRWGIRRRVGARG